MGLPSKQDRILNLFFNEGTKHWHFKDIVKKAKISEDRANYWLKKLVKEEIIKRVKPRGKMPYFIANFESSEYKNKKKLFALSQLFNSGFLDYLHSLKNANAIVIFGSYARADWYTESDIDLFVVGHEKKLDLVRYELKLGREIQTHVFKDKNEVKKIKSGLIHNVINGFFVKGKVQDLVEVSAR